ncbi:hypothetical protein SAMN05443636_0070 [Halobaculum gomorrense]|uniref:Uncharacterized protein n=1 Tax=Halobaculum gomorrense TaxID=43928 RepID=A0A1M5JEM0_9EURY|nr:hypothetical protein SAMN05443636_0070 [Halobaculum gomorrense]
MSDDTADPGAPASAADAVIDERTDGYRESLFDLLRLRTVSATGEGMDAGADAVRDLLAEHGLDARRIETDRYPLVYGERVAGDSEAPTVLFYRENKASASGLDPEAVHHPFPMSSFSASRIRSVVLSTTSAMNSGSEFVGSPIPPSSVTSEKYVHERVSGDSAAS